MKFIHLSDLHLGKRMENYSLIEDQEYILNEILKIIDDIKPDGIIIAGDVYDKSVPPVDAVGLFDRFIVQLASRDLQVYIISGNHDSPERLAFGEKLLSSGGIHISPVYNGNVEIVQKDDDYGTVNIYLLPFVKPFHVKKYYPEEDINSYTDALRVAIKNMGTDFNQRNVLVAHQFVTGALRSESEEITVGGLDNVDASVFDGFDYVALGHIHGPQNIGSSTVRYCGTPLKYSFSEIDQIKSVTVVELKEKGNTHVYEIPLKPIRDMNAIRGTFGKVTSKDAYEGTNYQKDYMKITLTDEDDIPDAVARLRMIYNFLVKIEYDNTRTRHNAEIGKAEEIENRSPLELFADFYQKQNGMPLTEEQGKYLYSVIEGIWEDTK